MNDTSLEESDIDIDSYGECLDDTIRGILRNADNYLNSTFFSAATSSELDTATLDDTSFENSLRDIDRRIAIVESRQQEIINTSSETSTMEPPPAPPAVVLERPQSCPTQRRSSSRFLRGRRQSVTDSSSNDNSTRTDELNSTDDDIVYVGSTQRVVPFVETIDLCSPVFPYRRRRNFVMDESIITLDDTPTHIPTTPLIFTPTTTTLPGLSNRPLTPDQPSPPKRLKLQRPESTVEAYAESSQSSGGLTCPVCLEGLKGRQPTSTICGHIYCKKCIHEVIRTTKKCALCKKPLNMKNIHPIYL